jgi:hypothetical protein
MEQTEAPRADHGRVSSFLIGKEQPSKPAAAAMAFGNSSFMKLRVP